MSDTDVSKRTCITINFNLYITYWHLEDQTSYNYGKLIKIISNCADTFQTFWLKEMLELICCDWNDHVQIDVKTTINHTDIDEILEIAVFVIA